MKTLAIILTFCFTGLCSAQFISADDKLHLGAGALISATTYTLVYTTTKNKKKAFWYSLGTSALAGIAKEVYDGGIQNERFDIGEAIATTIGGLTVSTTLSLFVGKKKNKRKAKIALVN
ncbi:hypothetical protein [Flavivirga rizhaonensis]|uniref:Lipoprotein n=1 Tax=Flavivirga rizhaonensis TaxID=2559571 RepID=A0A4S1E2S0_9FLAO|nr:hypothetical protein [Flavivirga rizhaonensis]TGV04653.1 hypothetical protein EM932_00570 [Flavivirga rizhaonensis]